MEILAGNVLTPAVKSPDGIKLNARLANGFP